MLCYQIADFYKICCQLQSSAVECKVIGHIIDYEYVSIDISPLTAPVKPDMLSYKASVLVKSITSDIKDALLIESKPKQSRGRLRKDANQSVGNL